MNRYLTFSLAISVTLSALAIPLRPANKPRAGKTEGATLTWTNEDLEQLRRVPGLISVVGQPTKEVLQGVNEPAQHLTTEDPEWYVAQEASLNARLETEQANLRHFTQALDDARELKSTTGGINLAEDNIGITPEATIDILQNRVRETQNELDALEDLARHNDILPGILREQRQGAPAETTVAAAEESQSDMSARGGDL